MGNCQTVDAAALVIEHPTGKLERMYTSLTAGEVMKMNPGHYVSLIIPVSVPGAGRENAVQFTRVKLLRPHDVLVLGRAYRLVATQEVMKFLRAKKHAKLRKNQPYLGEKLEMNSEKNTSSETEAESSAPRKHSEEATRLRPHRQSRPRSGSTNLAAGRTKSWQPSLQSISESGS